MRRPRARKRARARPLHAHRALVTNRVLRDPLRSCLCPETSETAEMPSDSSSPFTRGWPAHIMSPSPGGNKRTKATSGPATARSSAASEILGSEFPVEELVDHGLRVIGAAVLIIEVVRVLPDIDRQEGRLSADERHFGVGGAHDLERIPVNDEPGPSAAELLHRGGDEFLLDGVETAEFRLDPVGERTARLAPALGLERTPVEGVIPGLCRIVEQLALVRLSR